MSNNALTVLKVLLWGVCAFHVAIGAGLNLSAEDFARMVAQGYGAGQVDWTPQFVYMLRPIGAFMLALGVIAAAAALRPLAYRAAIYAFVMLFVLRAVHRLVFSAVLVDEFGIAPSRNIGNVIFFFCLATALVVSERLASTRAAASAS
jgi:hypothetical protein